MDEGHGQRTRNQSGSMEAVCCCWATEINLQPTGPILKHHSPKHSTAEHRTEQKSEGESPWEEAALGNIIVKYYIHCLPATRCYCSSVAAATAAPEPILDRDMDDDEGCIINPCFYSYKLN